MFQMLNILLVDLETQKTVESYVFDDPPTITRKDNHNKMDSPPGSDNEEPEYSLPKPVGKNDIALQTDSQVTETSNHESETEPELNCECAVKVSFPWLFFFNLTHAIK